MAKKPIDDKDKEKALKKLIGETVTSAGAIAPDEIPHKVKDRIRRQVCGDLDAESYVMEATKNGKKANRSGR